MYMWRLQLNKRKDFNLRLEYYHLFTWFRRALVCRCLLLTARKTCGADTELKRASQKKSGRIMTVTATVFVCVCDQNRLGNFTHTHTLTADAYIRIHNND